MPKGFEFMHNVLPFFRVGILITRMSDSPIRVALRRASRVLLLTSSREFAASDSPPERAYYVHYCSDIVSGALEWPYTSNNLRLG